MLLFQIPDKFSSSKFNHSRGTYMYGYFQYAFNRSPQLKKVIFLPGTTIFHICQSIFPKFMWPIAIFGKTRRPTCLVVTLTNLEMLSIFSNFSKKKKLEPCSKVSTFSNIANIFILFATMSRCSKTSAVRSRRTPDCQGRRLHRNCQFLSSCR